MHDALHAAFLLDLDGDDKSLAADRDQFILHRAAFGESPQISAQGLLNRAPLLFDLAANARQLWRGLVFKRAIGLDLVAKGAQELGEVDDLIREHTHPVPIGFHIRRRMKHDLAPFRRTIDDQDHVSNLRGLESGAGDAGFLQEQVDIDEPGKIKAATHAAELPNLLRKFLLALNPIAVRGGSESGNALLPKGRRGVSAEEFAERLKLQHACRTVDELTGHRNLW